MRPIYLVDFSCFSAPDELRVEFSKAQQEVGKWKVSRLLP
jgi:hypothetical protein